MRVTLAQRGWLLAIATVALAGVVVFAAETEHQFWITATPVAVAVYLIFLVHHGYLAVRELAWRRRKRTEQEALEQLALPEDTPRPVEFDGVRAIDEVQHRVLPRVADYQGRYFALGMRIALLPAIAIIFAAAQTIFHDNVPLAIGLIAAETIALFSMMLLVWIEPDPAQEWVVSRIRVELLRREQYLRMACVGPYLGLTGDSASRRVTSRIILVRDGDVTQLRQLITMTNGDASWTDEIWRYGGRCFPAETLADRMRSYLHYRIDKQRMWFTLGTKANEHRARRTTRIVKIVLMLATLTGAAQTVLIAQYRPADTLFALTTMLSLSLPAICAVLLSVQELLSYQRLATSYAETNKEIVRIRVVLTNLIDKLDEPHADADEISKLFQSVVLRMESELTQELLRWIMHIRRTEFDVAL